MRLLETHSKAIVGEFGIDRAANVPGTKVRESGRQLRVWFVIEWMRREDKMPFKNGLPCLNETGLLRKLQASVHLIGHFKCLKTIK